MKATLQEINMFTEIRFGYITFNDCYKYVCQFKDTNPPETSPGRQNN